MKTFFVLLLFAALPSIAQRQQIILAAAGNFNPTYYVELWNGANQITGSNADTVGGSVEYRYCFAKNWCAGPLYAQNKSTGVLWAPNGLGGGTYYRWPLMRYEALALLTARASISSKWMLDVQAGAGFVLSNGYGNSGWSEDFAVATGVGAERSLTPRWSLVASELFENTEQGCYGDSPTPGITYCAQKHSVFQKVKTGLVYKW